MEAICHLQVFPQCVILCIRVSLVEELQDGKVIERKETCSVGMVLLKA